MERDAIECETKKREKKNFRLRVDARRETKYTNEGEFVRFHLMLIRV